MGSCSCPGVVGATLGGGVGRYQSLHGLIIDALVSVRLITASGEIVIASETSNPELFWGIRGAGANFGIVTSATYKLSTLTNNGLALTVDFVFPMGMTYDFFRVLEKLGTDSTPGLSAITLFVYDEDTDLVRGSESSSPSVFHAVVGFTNMKFNLKAPDPDQLGLRRLRSRRPAHPRASLRAQPALCQRHRCSVEQTNLLGWLRIE